MRNISPLALGVLLTSSTLTVMAGAILGPVLNLMKQGLGVGPTAAGSLLTMHALFAALSSPLWGVVIDRRGPKGPYCLGLIGFGLAGGLGLFSISYWPLLVSRAFLGVACGAFFNAVTVFILNLFEGPDRNRIMGFRGSANSAGGVIWPLMGGILGTFWWRLPFAVYLVGIPLGILGWRLLPSVKVHRHAGAGGSLKGILRANPPLYLIFALMLLWSLLLYQIVIFMPQLLAAKGIHSPVIIALFITAFTICSSATAFLYGRFKGRTGHRVIAKRVTLVWAAMLAVLGLNPPLPVLAGAIAVFGIGQGALLPTLMVWLGELVPFSHRGRFSSILGTFTFVGMFISPLVFGPFVGWLGLWAVFAGGTALCLICLAWSFLAPEPRPQAEQD